MLKVEKLGQRAGRLQILDGGNFAWTRGVLAVIGGNGSGKTTLLRLIAGAAAPSAGTVSWNDVAAAKAVRRKGAIGYGPQERNLDLAISLREFLALCADLRGLGDRTATIAAVAEELRLTRQLDERLANLSGGGRRKAMTAQALLGTSELIVLDEPTSEVDYSASRHFWSVFQARGKSGALVIATHDVELALSSADAILLMQRGKPVRLAPASAFALEDLSQAIGDG